MEVKIANYLCANVILKLFKNRSSKFWTNDDPIDFTKDIQTALDPVHMSPLAQQKPDLPSWLPKIEQILK